MRVARDAQGARGVTPPRAHLVVNGDDGGLDEAIDRAMLACGRVGLLRSVSIAANGARARAMAAACADLGIGVGLHVNLTHGRAVAGPQRGLTRADGTFRHEKADFWQRATRSEIDAEAVEREVSAQWASARTWGIPLDHVDGHNHVHAFFVVLEALTRVMGSDAAGLFLRLPCEPECPSPEVPEGLRGLDLDAVAHHARAHGFRVPDRFVGLRFCVDPSREALRGLDRPVTGVTEWMVHPGMSDASPFRRDPRRERERVYLGDPARRDELTELGWVISTFGEANACASS